MHRHGAEGERGEGDDEGAGHQGGVSGVHVDAVVWVVFWKCDLYSVALRVYCLGTSIQSYSSVAWCSESAEWREHYLLLSLNVMV